MARRIANIVELSIHKRHLESLVEEQAAILRHSNDTMVDALSSIIEYRSVESGQHILRIRRFTQILLEQVAKSCPEYALDEQSIGLISSAAALHDIGKIVVLSLHQNTMRKVQEYCKNNGWHKNTLDCLLSGTNSFLIGEKMAEKWDLSPELSYVISHQIEPFNCDDDKIMLVKIVYLANVIDNILTDGDEDLEYKDSILYINIDESNCFASNPVIFPKTNEFNTLKLDKMTEDFKNLNKDLQLLKERYND
jgi:HD-like signal output (HDOD) protein